jgi:Arm DNA-binding domain
MLQHGATRQDEQFCCPDIAPAGVQVVKKALTDRALKAFKPAPEGKRQDHMDSVVPGFGVRVTEKGQRTFILLTRYPGAKNPTRRAIGEVGAITLEKAREKARHWLELVQQGKDPAAEEERQRLAERQRRADTFAAVAEDFIAEKLSGERKGKEVEQDIRRDLNPIWGARPITDITDIDIIGVVKAKKKSFPAQARNLLGIIKRFFAWAVDQRVYGLTASPAGSIKPGSVVGDKVSGNRILNDPELFALWRAAERTPYPWAGLSALDVDRTALKRSRRRLRS